MIRRFIVIIAILAAAPARAGCPDRWDGPTRCFDRLGRYPIEHLRAGRGITLEKLTALLGEPLLKTVKREKDPDYPVDRLDHETITLRFPREVVTLARRIEESSFWLERYEVDSPAIHLKECVIQTGQRRQDVLRALGFTGKAANQMVWPHEWCEGDLAYEEWATVTPHFGSDGLLYRITWDYWAD